MEKAKGGLKYVIRSIIAEEHEDDLMRMQRICFPDDDPIKIDSIGEWWMAFLDDAPAAFASVRASTASPLTGYLRRAGVMPGHRGQGLQRRLIRVRESFARRMGWMYVVSNTHRENIHSSNNFVRCGYETYFPRDDWAGNNSIYWLKFLGDPRYEDKTRRPK